jgi:hypothetical protein
MISPGTPRIQSSRGTMVASFRREREAAAVTASGAGGVES